MIAMRSSILGAYIHKIRNMLLVTGDPVPSVSRGDTTGVFDYHSIRLMQFMKEMNEEHFVEDPIVYGGALNYGATKNRCGMQLFFDTTNLFKRRYCPHSPAKRNGRYKDFVRNYAIGKLSKCEFYKE